MTVIGFNFNKISVEKKQATASKISVQNNIGISHVEEASGNIGGADSAALKFTITFKCDFQPDVGSISLEGEVVSLFKKKEGDAILKEWKEHKRVSQAHAPKILNVGLNRAQIMALLLSKEVNLPLPVRLPSIVPKENKA